MRLLMSAMGQKRTLESGSVFDVWKLESQAFGALDSVPAVGCSLLFQYSPHLCALFFRGKVIEPARASKILAYNFHYFPSPTPYIG